MDFVGNRTWIQLFDQQRREDGGRVAITGIGPRARELTYDALWESALRLARHLEGLGLKPGDRAMLLMDNVVEYPVALLAIHRLTAIAVTCNVRLADQEMAYQIDDAGCDIVVAVSGSLARAEAAIALAVGEPRIVSCDLDSSAYGAHAQELSTSPEPDDIATILYTSGSTDRPKGIRLSHGNYVFNAEVNRYLHGYTRGDVGLCVFPFYQQHGHMNHLTTWLCSGTPFVLPETFSASGFPDQIDQYGITVTCLNSTHVKMVLSKLAPDRQVGHSLRRVKLGLYLDEERFREFESRFHTRLANGYSQTEMIASVVHVPLEPVAARKPLSVGLPTLPFAVEVVDPAGTLLGANEVGEIVVRCQSRHGRSKGVVGKASDELDEAGWWHTGDLGRFDDDGYLYFVGRLKNMIKVGGFNVAAEEVERVLVESPAVAECAVIGVPDDLLDEGIVAFVTLSAGYSAQAETEIVALCADRLAPYKAPSRFIFIDEIPRAETGKYDTRQLRDRYLAHEFAGG